jgi:hypothetical protein
LYALYVADLTLLDGQFTPQRLTYDRQAVDSSPTSLSHYDQNISARHTSSPIPAPLPPLTPPLKSNDQQNLNISTDFLYQKSPTPLPLPLPHASQRTHTAPTPTLPPLPRMSSLVPVRARINVTNTNMTPQLKNDASAGVLLAQRVASMRKNRLNKSIN